MTVDEGAKDALVRRGSSLLCVGVAAVEGHFDAGDIVDIKDAEGHLVRARQGGRSQATRWSLPAAARARPWSATAWLAPLATRPLVHRDELIVFE